MLRGDFARNEPLVQELPVHEAYYWTAADGTLNIAMRTRFDSLLGRAFSGQWLLSLVLEDLPAGRGKLYAVQSREGRMLQSTGGDHRRGRSVRGIVTIQPRGNGGLFPELRGRFHLNLLQEQFSVLKGWSGSWVPLIVVGKFSAVPDRGAGPEILALTEADGCERGPLPERIPPRPTSRPSSRPSRPEN